MRGCKTGLARAGVLRLGAAAIWFAAVIQPAAAQFAVSEGGQPAYSIPIPVPPGIAGVEPKVALQYSRGAGGPFAAGWSLGGLSVITRCGSTESTDGVRRGVRYTSVDRFCLDGQRLLVTSADGVIQGQSDYTGATTEYRTEKDSYSRVRAYGGSSTSGPAYFKVWTKSGLVYEYGNGGNSLVQTVKGGASTQVVMAWAVNKISDTLGNYMSVSYTNAINSFAGSGGREWMVSDIRYTGNSTQLPTSRVQFSYEDRPDMTEAFHEGAKSVNTKRLASLSTYVTSSAGERRVAYFKLTHGISPNTGKSLLESFQQCSGTDTAKCLPKLEFTYSNGPAPAFSQTSLSSLTLTRKQDQRYKRGVYQGDFDGDGRQDLLVWDDDPSQNQLLLSNGDGTFRSMSSPLPGAPQIGHSNGCYSVTVADFNADGISDVLHVQGPDARPSGCGGVAQLAQIFLGKAAGGFNSPVPLNKTSGETLPLLRIDPGMEVCAEGEGTGDTFNCYRFEYFGGRNYILTDVNGDGLPDLLFTRTPPHNTDSKPTPCGNAADLTCLFLGTTTVGTYQSAPTSLASENLFSPGGFLAGTSVLQNTYQDNRVYLGDLNGDGLPDIYVRNTGVLFLATGSTGQFTRVQSGTSCAAGAEILDINGDGKWDVACMDPINTATYKAYVNDGSGALAFRSEVGGWRGKSCTELQAGDPVPAPCAPSERSYINYLAVDLDGDGVSDVLAIGRRAYGGGYPKYNGALKGQRDGTFVPYSIPSLENAPLSFETRQLLVGDFTGQGTVEFLRYSDDSTQNALFSRANAVPPDLLTTAKTSANARTSIAYRPLTDPLVYTRGFGAIYPVIDYGGAQWVVAQADAPDGRNGVVRTSYAYAAQRADLRGRGLLGFATVRKTSPGGDGTLLTTESLNRQDFPYTGLPAETRRYLTSAGRDSWISLATNEYNVVADTPCSTAGAVRIHRPVLAKTVEQTRDLGLSAISHVETRNENFNCDGDPRTVTITTRRDEAASETYVKQTANTYERDTSGDKWILSRLKRAVQTNTVPQSSFPPASHAGGSQQPTIVVSIDPNPMIVGQAATRTWTSTNATSVSFSCTAGAGGYTASGSKAISGSDTLTPAASWVNSPSTCTWTAAGPGGTATTTQTLTTSSGSGNLPTLTVTRNPTPFVADQPFTVSWSSTNATSVGYTCTSTGTGFAGSATMSTTSGTSNGTASRNWVGFDSNCVWTATGPGGSKTFSYVMQTVDNLPTLTVTRTPDPFVAGDPFEVAWSSTNATSVSYTCTSTGSGFAGSQTMPSPNDRSTGTADPNWIGYDSNCTWTATGPTGSKSVSYVMRTIPKNTGPAPTLTVTRSRDPLVAGQTYTTSWSSTNATLVKYVCTSTGTGFSGANTMSTTSGESTSTASAAWVGYDSNCTWTAEGPGGSKTVSYVLRTIPDPGPTLSVTRNPDPFIAGQGFTLNWASTNATTVGYTCTSSGTGFSGSATMPTTSGSSSGTASASWVGYDSNCTWTATGPDGSKSVSYVMKTTGASGPPTISVSMTSVWYTDQPPPLISLTTTNTSSVTYRFVNSFDSTRVKTGTAPVVNGNFNMPALDATWDGTWGVTWTATGPFGTATTARSVYIIYRDPAPAGTSSKEKAQ